MTESGSKKPKHRFNLRSLRLSLKYRPKILMLILKLKFRLKQKKIMVKKLQCKIDEMVLENRNKNVMSVIELKDSSTNTDIIIPSTDNDNDEGQSELTESNKTPKSSEIKPANSKSTEEREAQEVNTEENPEDSRWNINNDKESKSIAEQVAEVAQDAMKESEIAYVESAGMYIDYNTDYFYNSVHENRNKNVMSIVELKDSSTNTDIIIPSTDNDNDEDQSELTESNNTPKSSETKPANSKSTEEREAQEVNTEENPEDSGWNINNDKESKSIAEQVAEVAQDAIKESGMVYVEFMGMYYDYNTGYYYNSELGLYYHTDTECYYYYSEDEKNFVFHSYPDRSSPDAALLAHEKRKARKHKMARKTEDDIENLTKKLSQEKEDDGKEQVKKPKRKKNNTKKVKKDSSEGKTKEKVVVNDETEPTIDEEEKKEDFNGTTAVPEELEDGECSDTSSENSDDEDEDNKSNISTSTATDDESIAKHHPPCMRVIVRETSLPKLRVGNLFIVTKDGGTVGREGEQHTILLRDHNVSRNHLDIQFDPSRNLYMATDLGSKNGTILNGTRMSESQVMSKPMEIVHGSTLQLGETKLLCHIHPGNDTCGHCEPGLLMEAIEKEKKVAYTRTCNVQKQHQLELARLKNKYAPKPLAIEETAYNDRAQARREAVGSSHHSEKTQSTDVNTSIAPESKGFKMLEKMGWNKGEGLGKESQGETEPVPLISNEGKAGLGAGRVPQAPLVKNSLGQATMRLATRTKILKPPAKAFQNILDDDDEELE